MLYPKAFEDLQAECLPGRGELQPAVESTELVELKRSLGVYAVEDEAVFLSPLESITVSPLTEIPQPGVFYRGPRDHRSFSLGIDANAIHGLSIDTVTVKGGDLPHIRHTREGIQYYLWRRAENRQIPGGGMLSDMVPERAAAETLQAQALDRLGRYAYTAVPLRLSTLKTVDLGGKQMPIKEYLNSTEYAPTNASRVAQADIMNGLIDEALPLGDFLLDVCNVQPAVYVYGLSGHNLRVETAADAVKFSRNDADNSYSGYRQIETDSDRLPPFCRKDQVFRSLYAMLGEAYSFDPAEVLPKKRIGDKNYQWALHTIPRRCEKQGITDIVLDTFTQRVTEVVALAHAQDCSLRSILEMGGACHPRNVTIGGSVLDLDTYGSFGKDWENIVYRELSEIKTCVETLHKLVAGPPHTADARVYHHYLANLEALDISGKQCDKLRNVLGP